MKQKLRWFLPVAEILLCLSMVLGQQRFSLPFSSIIAFPFQPMAYGLRLLSLSSAVGNLAAIALYLLVGLCPLAALLRKNRQKADWLLVLFSGLLLFSIYCMVNPGALSSWVSSPLGSAMEAPLLGTLLYSVLAAYGVLRLISAMTNADRGLLFRAMDVLLYLLGLVLLYQIFGSRLSQLLTSREELQAANSGNERLLGTTCVFLNLQYVVSALPDALELGMLLLLHRLLRALRDGGYCETALCAAQRLSRFCGRALAAVILSVCALNLAQLAMLHRLVQVDITVQLPLFSLILLVAALLLAQLVKESCRLQSDNDLFI